MSFKTRLELFDQQQFVDLQRLREDRNRCAHPSFQKIEEPYRPSAELARVHLRNAVEHVLAQIPIQGKSALKAIEAMVSSKYFPADPDDAIAQLKQGPMGNANDVLVNAFVDNMIYGLFDDNSPLKKSKRTVAALKAGVELYRGVAEPRLLSKIHKIVVQIEDKDMPALSFVIFDLELWSQLNKTTKSKVRSFIKNGSVVSITPILSFACNVSELRDTVGNRVGDMSVDELAQLIKSNFFDEIVIEAALEIYCNVGSWNAANSAAEKLILPIVTLLKKPHIERIFKAPKENGADLRGSGGFNLFISALYNENVLPKDELDALLSANGLEDYKPDSEDNENDEIPF